MRITLCNLNPPDNKIKKLIEEDVYKTHESSSEDEYQSDVKFKELSSKLTHDLITTNFNHDKLTYI